MKEIENTKSTEIDGAISWTKRLIITEDGFGENMLALRMIGQVNGVNTFFIMGEIHREGRDGSWDEALECHATLCSMPFYVKLDDWHGMQKYYNTDATLNAVDNFKLKAKDMVASNRHLLFAKADRVVLKSDTPLKYEIDFSSFGIPHGELHIIDHADTINETVSDFIERMKHKSKYSYYIDRTECDIDPPEQWVV